MGCSAEQLPAHRTKEDIVAKAKVVETIQLDETKALKLQLAIAAKENFELKVRAGLKDAQNVINAMWVEAGLELGVQYDLNFQSLTATKVVTGPQKLVK